ncbi:hypothetical protein F2Q69_00042593 [Brassica cretica]|uniref:Uncharacterized protein n=1 Tax=Brassica cretica TaxID=69181 RepID=A0A8S9NHV2_BRACR|nr:hypothetical protein F2Q69_00042593 [Brassica cretica]
MGLLDKVGKRVRIAEDGFGVKATISQRTRVQGNSLFAGSRTLRETGSWPMDEWLHDGVVTGSDPNVLWAVLR